MAGGVDGVLTRGGVSMGESVLAVGILITGRLGFVLAVGRETVMGCEVVIC